MPTNKIEFNETKVDALYEEERNALNQELGRKAALSMLCRMRFGNQLTVGSFMTQMQEHKDVWGALSGIGVMDFARAVMGGNAAVIPGPTAANEDEGEVIGRTRLTDAQKEQLKELIMEVMEPAEEGIGRRTIAERMGEEQVAQLGIAQQQLAAKLKQPLAELVKEGRLATDGERRLMVYVLPNQRRRKRATSPAT